MLGDTVTPNHMPTNSFFSSTKTVLLGMAAAQSIPLLGSLLITRLYAPAEFGVFSAWLGMVLMAAVIVTGRLEVALAVEPDGEPRRFAMVATLTTIAIGSGVLGVLSLVAYRVVPAFNAVTPGLVLMFLPATLLVAALQTWQSWAAAEGKYRDLSSIRIAQALAVTAIQIIVGGFAPYAVGLAFGHILGALIGVCVAAYFMPVEPFRQPGRPFWPSIKAFWKAHRRFPLLALPADTINAASGQLPLLVIASKFGPEAAGLFALTFRVMGAPIGLLGAAVLDVFKRTAATSYRDKGNCRDEYLRTLRVLGAAAIAFAIGVMFVAEPLFVVAFGEPWRQAGTIATWLMPMFALKFVASPLSYVFYVASKQHVDLGWQVALLFMTLGTLYLSTDNQTAIQSYSVGYSLFYIIYLALSWHYSKGKLG